MRGDYFPQVTYTLFGEIASNIFHLASLDMCCMRAGSTSSQTNFPVCGTLKDFWFWFWFWTLAKPTSETTWTTCRELSKSKNRPDSKTYLGGGAQVGKDLILCVPHEAHFFPSVLILVWTFQPSFEIDMDTSIHSICNSTHLCEVFLAKLSPGLHINPPDPSHWAFKATAGSQVLQHEKHVQGGPVLHYITYFSPLFKYYKATPNDHQLTCYNFVFLIQIQLWNEAARLFFFPQYFVLIIEL